MKYYLIAGEASGDLHGSNLIKALRALDDKAAFRAWGGDLMQRENAFLVEHYRHLAFMGFVEVILHLPTILRNFSFCQNDILEFRPDALILIDYPGFNLRIAKWAKSKGIRVFYYISPQLWAWHSSRVRIIRECVEKMYVILPFEKEFYRKNNIDVEFVGHPLLEVVDTKSTSEDLIFKNHLDKRPVIALLPGSRKQEVKRMLPIMAEVSHHFPDFQFIVAGLSSLDVRIYTELLLPYPAIRIVIDDTYSLLRNAFTAVVTSGTATLEAALLNVPQVVCYKGNKFSFALAKILINRDLRFISLVNLISGKPIVVELIQKRLGMRILAEEINALLQHDIRAKMLNDYMALRHLLGTKGASARVAKSIFERLTGK
jgi:lipid-A-disaccharide synthase